MSSWSRNHICFWGCRMRAFKLSSAGLLTVLTLGCVQAQHSAVTPATMVGPHGGACSPLPDGLGFAEVVIEMAPTRDAIAQPVQVVAYFFAPDLKNPLQTRPSDVTVELTLPRLQIETLGLLPEPNPEDPLGSARYASSPGPYFMDEPVGRLNATIGTSRFSASFARVR
jgi:hypothetical protein